MDAPPADTVMKRERTLKPRQLDEYSEEDDITLERATPKASLPNIGSCTRSEQFGRSGR